MQPMISEINPHDSSRRQTNNTDLVDRISALPDSILGLILSFLPTKEAVSTVFLSKRWKFVWRTVHNLDFFYDYCFNDDCWEGENECENMKFVRFVNRVLLLHEGGLLNRFSLVWNPLCISSHATSWINTAITRNVHQLSLLTTTEKGFDLPITVFNCGSLQSLEFNGITCIPDDIVLFLPRLESLELDPVSFKSEKAFESLVSGCPMLHYLHLHVYIAIDYGGDDFMCIISSTSLRRLEVRFENKCSLKLKASSLEYLRLNGDVCEIFVEKGLSSLVEVDFNIKLHEEDFPDNSIVEAVRAFDHAKFLSLSTDVLRALNRATISLSTEFKRLVKLVTRTYCISLQDFIQSSDNLEVLIIYQYSNHPCESYLHDHSNWTTPVEVPRCLSNSLKKVRIDCYKGLEGEREMIRYMLKYGNALEVMQITYDSQMYHKKFELLQEICEVPRKSPACEVQFDAWTSNKKYKELL